MKRLLPALCTSAMVLCCDPALAAKNAGNADDICSPAADPCVIDKIYDVTGPLDFGLRKVLIVPGGRLNGQPGVSLAAGEIEIAVGISADASIVGNGGSVDIAAVRACSGDSATPCFIDWQCSNLGTCSAVSTGQILADGMISTSGGDPRDISISAAGDITLKRRVNASATAAAVDPGTITIESFQGSVTTSGQIVAAAALGIVDYHSGSGGDVYITAAVDIRVGAMIRVWGEGHGGTVNLPARRDVILNSDIMSDGGGDFYANGGYANLDAGRDISVETALGGDLTQEINTDGGGRFRFTGYGNDGYWASGYGGYQYLIAYNDITLGPDSTLHSQGGPGGTGGAIHLHANYDIQLDGTIRAQGTPPTQGGDTGAGAGSVHARSWEGDLTMSQDAVIDTSSPLGQGYVNLDARDKIRVDGHIDVRGLDTGGEYASARPGFIGIGYEGTADITIGGKLRGGGNDSFGYNWEIDGCRLHLTQSAVLDQSIDVPNPYSTGIDIAVLESMVADHGSKIETDPSAGTRTFIRYRDPKKPPALNGTIDPPPLLAATPDVTGCPVCGNGEIDWSETCDDGNTAGGDGCSADCQDEGCIADTPGYPATALCDDGIACSEDTCDNEHHLCRNQQSCDDGVACTADACTADGCTHTIDDTRCDDHNDCTFDLCNPATGCVYADLTAISCEDGNFCTAPGTCEHGTCIVAAGKLTTDNALKTRVFAGSHNDRLKAQLELPASRFDADPTITGAQLMLGNEVDHKIYDVDLPAARWIQTSDGLTDSFRFVDAGSNPDSVNDDSTVTVVRDQELGVTRVTVRMRGAELSGSMDQDRLSLSLLFGEPAPGHECVTARHVPCRQKGSIVTCRD